jgi:serine protease
MGRLSYSKLTLSFVSFILFVFIAGISVDTINAENGNNPPFHTGPSVSNGKPDDTHVPPFFSGQVVIAGAPETIPSEYYVIKYLPHANLTVVAVEPGKERGHIQSLTARGFRANFNLQAKAFAAPNDKYYGLQWHFPMVQSEEAWGLLSNGVAGVTVAVLDTGLKTGGPDGIGCVVSGWNTIDPTLPPTDGNGHGTHVSGTIAQATNNGIGVAGLAHGAACILPVKVLGDNGVGGFAEIADGVYYAVTNGAKVINMSLGTNARFNYTNDTWLDPALDHAYANGVTVVCASGNDGSRKNVSYPAIYPTTIGVGAVDLQSKVTRYSNRGYGLDIVAPGGDNNKDMNGDGYADGVLQETYINNAWGYWFFDGTSMASPHVAAVAAMLYSYGTANTPDSIYQALTSKAQDLNDPGFDSTSGYGLVQAYSALKYDPGSCIDADDDGFCANMDPVDCDDNDFTVYPGAPELCDGRDNNCDGVTDEGCPTGGCTDNDGDGWCVEDGDCDDYNPNVYPGHQDKRGRWGRDEVDNDCNGIIDG